MSDGADRAVAGPTWSDALRRLRELSAQITAAAQSAAVAGAKATPPALAQPLARYAGQLLAVNAAITTPLRQLLNEQEQLVTKMAEWAEQHQHMSEQIAEWADQQRRLSEQMVDLARPFLDQSAMLESLRTEWSGRSADRDPDTPSAGRAEKRPAKKAAPRKAAARRR